MKNIITLFVVGIALALSSCSTVNLNNGLITHLPMDGEKVEASKNKADVKGVGVRLTDNRFGEAGKAYRFEYGDYIGIENYKLFGKSPQTMSMSIWMSIDHARYRGARIIDKSIAGTRHGIVLDTYPNSGRGLRAMIGGGTHCVADIDLIFGEWIHIAFVFDKGKYTFYVNGRNVGSGNTIYDYFVDVEHLPLVLGKSQGVEGGKEYFAGSMDDLRIYNRPLTEKEVSKLYNEGNYPALAKDESYWRLNKEPVLFSPPVIKIDNEEHKTEISIVDVKEVD